MVSYPKHAMISKLFSIILSISFYTKWARKIQPYKFHSKCSKIRYGGGHLLVSIRL
jgi:hypothetical protein